MLFFSLLFLLGDIFLQQFKHLPNFYWVMSIAIVFIYLIKNSPHKILCLAFICGFLWSFGDAYLHLESRLPKEEEGKNLLITGYIASIPNTTEHQTAFLFSLDKVNTQSRHGLIKLSWMYPKEKMRVGDQWQLYVHLKRIHGLMNEGGFDYEAWAFQEGIQASGYVTNNVNNKLIQHSVMHFPIDQFRQYLKEKIETHLPHSTTSAWITALAVGERQNIPEEAWEVLRNTGTNHLMAIAGLHIGFMSAFIFAITQFFWRRIPRLTVFMPAQHAGAISALLMACLYAALAGFSIPTQRACIMIAAFLLLSLFRRNIISWQGFSIALLITLLVNPLSILTESFWLSFSSVALIIYGVSGRLNPKGIWWKWGRIQWVIALGLVPISIGLFQQCSTVGLIANTIAIPWVGFVIVPFTLLGCFFLLFSAKIGSFLLLIADKNLNLLWIILTYLSHFSWASWYQFIPSLWIIIFSCVGMVLLLLPQGMPGRWLGIVWILPLLLYKPPSPKTGEWWFTLLDVGQGLSAVVQTSTHVLVFDAGARLSANYDMGNSVVVPFLRTLAAKKVDMMVISHGDNDHSGGSYAILKQFPVLSVKTSVPEIFKTIHADYCLAGETWTWDKVTFQFLYPSADNLDLDNDSSCVLKISNANHSVLLTGDIEKHAEKYLIEHDKDQLKADILVAPHHGSKTSAEDDFIHAVNPAYVLFPVGYRNRYHFPNADVVEKYKQLQVLPFDTVNAGAIHFTLSSPILYRTLHRHYWMDNA